MSTNRTMITLAAVGMLGLLAAACSSGGVAGHAYQDSSGSVKIAFSTGSKAYLSMGAMTQTCSYSESGHAVVLTCTGSKIKLTMNDDGTLSGPPGGLVGRLTKVAQ